MKNLKIFLFTLLTIFSLSLIAGTTNVAQAGTGSGSVTVTVTPPPVINGGWSAWSTASTQCGYTGTQTRTCTNPTPSGGGANCVGSSTQSYTNSPCPINGGWSAWSSFSACSVTACGQTGTQTQTRTCTNPTPAYGGASCSGSSTQSQSCSTAACPINGGWSAWSPASCPTACGTAASTINRTCTNPTPANGGTYCSGSSSTYCAATASCTCSAPLTQNVTVACDLNAYGYSATSGGVTRSQTKSAYPGCTFGSPVTTSNSTYVTDNCTYPAVVNGGWSAWSPSSCPTACGLSASNQTRSCNNPTPSGGGLSCVGSSTSSCAATAPCTCSAPLTQTQNVNCPYGYTGSITQTSTKSAYPSCTFGGWVETSRNCTSIPPITVSLSASPAGPLVTPGSTTLTWTTTGSPTSCTASNYWSGSKTPSGGSELRSGMTVGTSNFIITCSKYGVPDATASVNVSVVPIPTGSISATDCFIAQNASSCNTSLVWNTTNPFGTSAVTTNYPSSGTTVATANSSTGTLYGITNGATSFYLYNNGTQLGTTATANATCTAGTVWNASSGKCKPSSGTLSATNCVIALGGSSCPSTLTWSTDNPANGVTSVIKTPDSSGTIVATANNGTTTYTVPYSSRIFVLMHSNSLLSQATATATCAVSTHWGGSSCVPDNNAPNTPTITGNTDFYINTLQTFNITATDPDGNTIRYGIDWNNDNVADYWTSPYVASGTTMFGSNSWATPGTYYIKALAQDAPGLNSPWSILFTVHVTNPPPPGNIVSFTTDKLNVEFGQSANLIWTSTDATSCAMTSVPTPSVNLNGLPASGTKKLSPLKTTIYSLICTGIGGSSPASQVTVTVGKIKPIFNER